MPRAIAGGGVIFYDWLLLNLDMYSVKQAHGHVEN